jgi:hypothetical protein
MNIDFTTSANVTCLGSNMRRIGGKIAGKTLSKTLSFFSVFTMVKMAHVRETSFCKLFLVVSYLIPQFS